MRITIKTWPEKVILSARSESSGIAVPFARVHEAMHWLRPQIAKPLIMQNMRSLLREEKIANVEKMNNQQIVRCVSFLLFKKRLVLTKAISLKIEPAIIVQERAVPPPATQTVSAPREQPAIAPAPERVDNTDYEAQAATLIAASEDGAPFCEECEKKNKNTKNAA